MLRSLGYTEPSENVLKAKAKLGMSCDNSISANNCSSSLSVGDIQNDRHLQRMSHVSPKQSTSIFALLALALLGVVQSVGSYKAFGTTVQFTTPLDPLLYERQMNLINNNALMLMTPTLNTLAE